MTKTFFRSEYSRPGFLRWVPLIVGLTGLAQIGCNQRTPMLVSDGGEVVASDEAGLAQVDAGAGEGPLPLVGSQFFSEGTYRLGTPISIESDNGNSTTNVFPEDTLDLHLLWQEDGHYQVTLDGRVTFDWPLGQEILCESVSGRLAVDDTGNALTYQAQGQCSKVLEGPIYENVGKLLTIWSHTNDWLVRYEIDQDPETKIERLTKVIREVQAEKPKEYRFQFFFLR